MLDRMEPEFSSKGIAVVTILLGDEQGEAQLCELQPHRPDLAL